MVPVVRDGRTFQVGMQYTGILILARNNSSGKYSREKLGINFNSNVMSWLLAIALHLSFLPQCLFFAPGLAFGCSPSLKLGDWLALAQSTDALHKH